MKSLKDFAAFVKKNHLDENALEQLRILKEVNAPIMQFYSHLSDVEQMQLCKKNIQDFYESIENGTALERAKESLRKWEANELNAGISKDSLHPSDLVLIYTAQKVSFLKFLPLFTNNTQEFYSIFKELEMYFSEVQDEAVQLLFKIKKESEELIHENEKTLSQLFKDLPIGIFIIDKFKKPYYINKLGAKLLCKKSIELASEIKEVYTLYIAGTNDQYPEEDTPIVKALKGESSSANDIEVHCKTGVISLEIWANPVYDKNGEIKYAIAAFKDITEQKKAANEVKVNSLELERSNKELEMFSSAASHDLLEPLRTISSYLSLLKARHSDNVEKDAHEFIEFAIDGSERMRKLILNLLEFSKVKTTKKILTNVDMNHVVNDVLKNLENMIKETNSNINVSSLPTIKIDYSQISQLIQNLIVNGIKFNKSETPEIIISAQKEGGFYLFTVKDNGIGIDEKYATQIFEIFQRLHGRSEYPGTGLGLSICKRIVESHGGKIWLTSEPGKGTTFYFTLRANLD